MLAQHLQDKNKSYRIITPYDAQRNTIESGMKQAENLNWGDKCFNVDAFQGKFLYIFSAI
jgi:regulator of nonsense transcripts 1